MTDEELAAEVAELEQERERRRRREEAEQEKARIVAQVDALLLELQQLDGVQAGDEWKWPASAAGAYPHGAVVTWEGFTWTNEMSSNPHRPGESGWAIVPERDPDSGAEIPPPYVQPAGAHDAYPEGKRITWEDGLVYAAARDGVAHTPAEAAEEWRQVEDEPDEPEPADPDDADPEGEDPEEEDRGDDPEESPTPEIPEWEVGAAYEIGDELTYQGVTYRLIQNHTSAAHWPPDQVASIYEVI